MDLYSQAGTNIPALVAFLGAVLLGSGYFALALAVGVGARWPALRKGAIVIGLLYPACLGVGVYCLGVAFSKNDTGAMAGCIVGGIAACVPLALGVMTLGSLARNLPPVPTPMP
jgi:hypothetical protein